MKLDKPLTNCINCGGVLKDGVCPFCDSDYRNINADSENGYVNIVFHGHIYKAHLTNLAVIDTCAAHVIRDITGKLHYEKYPPVLKFEFTTVL